MAQTKKYTQFAAGGQLINGDIVVGLRAGVNTYFDVSGSISPVDADYILGTADALLPNAQVLGDLGSGIVVNSDAGATGTLLTRTLTGTANQIDVSNGTGVGANPTIGLSDDVILPGSGGFGWVSGTTGERPGAPVDGETRWNSTTNQWEGWNGTSWVAFSSSYGASDFIVEAATAREIGRASCRERV